VIDDARRQRLGGRNRFCRRCTCPGAHRRAAQPWQPLSAAGARDDTEEHFGLADSRVLRRDAEVARLRDLEGRRRARCREWPPPAVWTRPSTRFSSACVFADSRERVLARLQQLERLDVGARNERRAGADEHERVGARIRHAARDRRVDVFPDRRGKRIDGWVVDRDDGDPVLQFRIEPESDIGRLSSLRN